MSVITHLASTDVTGKVFISYRRSRRREVDLLAQAMRDVGVPLWRDVADLQHEPTEDALRRQLHDPSTAGAVLFLTPEARGSAFIRTVEVPEIVNRHSRRDDGFWFIPVAAGGLSYTDASQELAGTAGAEEIARWHLHQADDPFSRASAAAVAAEALRERLAALHRHLAPQAPLRIRLDVRANSTAPGDALVLDWRSHFSPHADRDTWDMTLIPALDTVRTQLLNQAQGRAVELTGTPSLPAAVALGHALPEPLPLTVRWVQWMRGGGEQVWSLSDAADAEHAQADGWTATTSGQDVNGQHLAVLVNVANDVSARYHTIRSALPQIRAKIVVDHRTAIEAPPGERPDNIRIGDGATAASLARLISRAVRNALDRYGSLEAVHLFLSGPAGLAVLVGQLTNTWPPLVTYDARDATAPTPGP